MQIKAVVADTGVSAFTIRFYEKKGLLTVARDKNGIRDFDEKSLNRLRWIQCYRRAGLPIKDILRITQGNLSLDDFLTMLDNAKNRLESEMETLEFTRSCLETKRYATLSGEPLTEITACAPLPHEIETKYSQKEKLIP